MDDADFYGIDAGLRRAFFRAHNTVGRVTLPLGDDTKETQTHQIVGYDSGKTPETRPDMQRYGEFGFTSMPLAGAKAIANYQSGHRGFATVVGVEDPRYRPKGLKPGESGIYAVDEAKKDGTGGKMWHAFTARLKKVASMLGVTLNIGEPDTVTINVGTTAKAVTINVGSTAAKVIIKADSYSLEATSGDIKVNGVSLVNHTHPQPNDSAGDTEADTGPPNKTG